MSITRYTSVFVSIAVVLVLASFFSIWKYTVPLGVDFTGGTVVEFTFPGLGDKEESLAQALEMQGAELFRTGDGYRVTSQAQFETIDLIITSFAVSTSTPTYSQVLTVGPSLGEEMRRKALIGITVGLLAILAFIAFSFRHVSRPIASWKYGVMAILTLLHDIVIPVGVYAYLSHLYGLQADTLFVVALLTILGISISDKIVVFDRIREHLKSGTAVNQFADTVDKSLRQTFVRSVNTSLTIVLALLVLFVYGPESTKYFSLVMMIGVVVGTYSSIFVASPLLVWWNKGKK